MSKHSGHPRAGPQPPSFSCAFSAFSSSSSPFFSAGVGRLAAGSPSAGARSGIFRLTPDILRTCSTATRSTQAEANQLVGGEPVEMEAIRLLVEGVSAGARSIYNLREKESTPYAYYLGAIEILVYMAMFPGHDRLDVDDSSDKYRIIRADRALLEGPQLDAIWTAPREQVGRHLVI